MTATGHTGVHEFQIASNNLELPRQLHGCCSNPWQWFVVERDVNYRCNQSKNNTAPKNAIVMAGLVIDQAAKPNAEKAADLMANKCKADEGSHILCAKYLDYDTGSQRHGPEPQYTQE